MRRLIWVAAAGLLLSSAAAEAASLNHFTSAWFFGDSLTDAGNLFKATGGAIPEDPPYFEGRRTNGPVWADHVADDFRAKGLETQNFAYAFANAVTNVDGPPLPIQVPDFEQQIDSFATDSGGRLGSRPIAMVLLGSNDILGALQSNPFGVVEAAALAANAVADGIDELRGLGIEDFLVFKLPPLDKAPEFTLFQPDAAPLAKAGTDSFNATLAGRLAGAPNVLRVDLHAAFEQLLADPAAFGIENTTTPCYIPTVSLCSPEEADKYAFFDRVHPTRIVHTEIAGLVSQQVAPVPLPAPVALILVGMAGLGLAGRRRRG